MAEGDGPVWQISVPSVDREPNRINRRISVFRKQDSKTEPNCSVSVRFFFWFFRFGSRLNLPTPRSGGVRRAVWDGERGTEE